MSYEPKYPLNIVPVGGDTKQSGFTKVMNEFSWIYGILSGLFSQTSGHKHTGAINDAPQITTSGIADEAITAEKIASGVLSFTASSIANAPAGNIAATTVQAAINELDTEKAKLAGNITQIFSAANATADGNVVNIGQLLATLSANGEVKIPVLEGATVKNFIIKWGTTANIPVSSTVTTTFATPFPTACFVVLGTIKSSSTGIVTAGITDEPTTTGFKATNTNTGSAVQMFYIAIGC